MNRNLILSLIASAAIAAPMAAQAQSQNTQTGTVSLTGNVERACMIGAPTAANLAFGSLTDSTTGRVSNVATLSTLIPMAWCNTPSRLKMTANVMTLGAAAPTYSTPTGFSRLVTYDANLTGWPEPLSQRPVLTAAEVATDASGAHAATPGLTLTVSNVGALNAAGASGDASLVLEAGAYSGSVVIALAVD